MALVKIRARLRTEGSKQITDSDLRTNEQAISVARGEGTLPSFIARGTARWREIRAAYSQAAVALDATGQADDRELASDVRGFLDKHQGMNTTPEVFAAHHARIIAAEKSKADMPAPDRPPKDRGRGR
jgi:type IV secretion system T-DNA border endonuclease VirD2